MGMKVLAVPDDVFGELSGLLWLANGFEEPLARALTPEAWVAEAIVGADVPPERLLRIRMGGHDGDGIGAEQDAVFALVERSLAQAPRGTAFLAIDAMAKPGDGALARTGAPYAPMGETIIYPVYEPDAEQIRAAWLWSGSAAGQVGFVCPHAPGSPFDADTIATTTTLVVFAAYDGEGALVLTRR
jgi:hypothetical protein